MHLIQLCFCVVLANGKSMHTFFTDEEDVIFTDEEAAA